MISHRHRCIFVHIPKTGGSSIEDAIWERPRRVEDLWMGFVRPGFNKYQSGGLQHLLARQIREEVGEDIFARYFKFSVVRNPWDRAVSQWRYMTTRKDLPEFFGIGPDAPLADYLEAAAASGHVQALPQWDFLHDTDGARLVDVIGRFETLAQDAAAIFERIGLTGVALPHAMKSERDADYRLYHDARSRALVERLYARDIEAFGYSF